MLIVILAFVTAFIITYVSLPVVITIAKEKKILDNPNNRKIHKEPIPYLGGLAIFAGSIISMCIFWESKTIGTKIQYIIAAYVIIFLLGLKDDIIGISPRKKFFGEILAASIIIFKMDLVINNFYNLFGIGKISEAFSLGLTYLTILLIINAYNLIDGMDGLGASLGVFSITLFGAFFFLTGHKEYSILSASMVGALLAFLIFNYHPAKIFMGDTGSLLIGLINAVLAIKLITVVGSDSANGVLTHMSSPVVAMSFIFIPLFDAVRVFFMRLVMGKSPFAAEKNHIHHILLGCGFGHTTTIVLLIFLNAIIVGLSVYLKNANNTLTLLLLVCVNVCFYVVANQKKLEREKHSGEKKSQLINIKRG